MFITSETLRQNVVIAFRYVIFLVALENENELPGPISYALFKDIIIHTATIVESCLHFALQHAIRTEMVEESAVMPKVKRYKDRRVLHELSDIKRIVGQTELDRAEELDSKTSFQTLIRAARKAGILDDDAQEAANELREQRNRIHLASLTTVDDFYTQLDAEAAFSKAKRVISAVEAMFEETWAV